MPREIVLSEFEHTWGRHSGQITVAAPILGMSPQALSRALYRAKSDGEQVRFVDDLRKVRSHGRGAP
jgi:hypothetical protein